VGEASCILLLLEAKKSRPLRLLPTLRALCGKLSISSPEPPELGLGTLDLSITPIMEVLLEGCCPLFEKAGPFPDGLIVDARRIALPSRSCAFAGIPVDCVDLGVPSSAPPKGSSCNRDMSIFSKFFPRPKDGTAFSGKPRFIEERRPRSIFARAISPRGEDVADTSGESLASCPRGDLGIGRFGRSVPR